MGEERRKFPRVDVKYKINVICAGEVVRGGPKNFVFHTYTENLSEGGIRVVLEKEVRAGSMVELELFITDKESMPIKCSGTAVWTKRANPEGTKPDLFHTGIQFSGLTNIVQRQLLRDVIGFYLGGQPKDLR